MPAVSVPLSISQPLTQVSLTQATPAAPIELAFIHSTQQVALQAITTQATIALSLVQQSQQVNLVIFSPAEAAANPWGKTVFTYTAGQLTQKQLYNDTAGTTLHSTYTYTYSITGSLEEMTIEYATTGITELRTFTYDPSGNLISITRTYTV